MSRFGMGWIAAPACIGLATALSADEPAAPVAEKSPAADAATVADVPPPESADPVAKPADAPATSPTAEETQALIKQLDSEKFATREAATHKLIDAGAAVVDAVIAAVDSKSREVSMRAMQILEQTLKNSSEAAQAKIRAALEKIAQQPDSPAGARRPNCSSRRSRMQGLSLRES